MTKIPSASIALCLETSGFPSAPFGTDNAEHFLAATAGVAAVPGRAVAVDLNLGCPARTAGAARYGACLLQCPEEVERCRQQRYAILLFLLCHSLLSPAGTESDLLYVPFPGVAVRPSWSTNVGKFFKDHQKIDKGYWAMRILGYKISIQVKIKREKYESPYRVDTAIQKKILGSHSQYLEDIFIDSIFRGKTTGTYVDIGANDPSELSNTKRFYDRGWSGVNVEPDVTMYEKISRVRQRDINLNVGIGGATDNLTFFQLSPNTLSTFNKKAAMQSVKKEGATIVSETTVPVISLAELFRTTLSDRPVDFLSVDAEGYEVEILSSNDWKIYRPIAIIVEVNQDKEGRVVTLLKKQGYILVHCNGTNGIFVDGNAACIKTFMQDNTEGAIVEQVS